MAEQPSSCTPAIRLQTQLEELHLRQARVRAAAVRQRRDALVMRAVARAIRERNRMIRVVW